MTLRPQARHIIFVFLQLLVDLETDSSFKTKSRFVVFWSHKLNLWFSQHHKSRHCDRTPGLSHSLCHMGGHLNSLTIHPVIWKRELITALPTSTDLCRPLQLRWVSECTGSTKYKFLHILSSWSLISNLFWWYDTWILPHIHNTSSVKYVNLNTKWDKEYNECQNIYQSISIFVQIPSFTNWGE